MTRRAVLAGVCWIIAVVGGVVSSTPAFGAHPTGSGPFAPGLPAFAKSASAQGYTKATAASPNFDNRAIWPTLTGKEAFITETWPAPARTLVWARPGMSGNFGKNGELNPADPGSWIDLSTGKPPERVILDEETDLVLPASPTAYGVGFRGSGLRETFRHITVENNARFGGGGDGAGRRVFGNVWVKRGGSIYCQGSTTFQGDRHTFFRNDNERGEATMCSQYFTFDLGERTIEFMGMTSVLDEFNVMTGTVIVGIDSVLQPGRSAEPKIEPAGALVLLDGAYFGKWINEFHRAVDLQVSGTLQAGLPERPIARSAAVGLSFRNSQKLDFSPWSDDPKKGIRDKRLVSAMFRRGARVLTHSTNADAVLLITWTGIEATNVIGDPAGRDDKARGQLTNPDMARAFNSIPRKITVFFEEGVTLDGVQFDNVHAGGLLIETTDAPKPWTNVRFGSRNEGTGPALFQIAQPSRGGEW